MILVRCGSVGGGKEGGREGEREEFNNVAPNVYKLGVVAPVRGIELKKYIIKIKEKRREALFQASESAQPSGEENILKLVWEANKIEASQEIDSCK